MPLLLSEGHVLFHASFTSHIHMMLQNPENTLFCTLLCTLQRLTQNWRTKRQKRFFPATPVRMMRSRIFDKRRRDASMRAHTCNGNGCQRLRDLRSTIPIGIQKFSSICNKNFSYWLFCVELHFEMVRLLLYQNCLTETDVQYPKPVQKPKVVTLNRIPKNH